MGSPCGACAGSARRRWSGAPADVLRAPWRVAPRRRSAGPPRLDRGRGRGPPRPGLRRFPGRPDCPTPGCAPLISGPPGSRIALVFSIPAESSDPSPALGSAAARHEGSTPFPWTARSATRRSPELPPPSGAAIAAARSGMAPFSHTNRALRASSIRGRRPSHADHTSEVAGHLR